MYIDISIREDVCFIYLNRRDTNGLNQSLLDELYDKVCWVSGQENVKAVVLTSRLSFGFSSGLDLGSFMNRPIGFAEKIYDAVYRSYQIVKSILQSPKIFIAALSGPVIGSAASIAFGCDLRIAALGTWFWLPDTQYGGFLADGGVELLTKLVGSSRTFMLALTNGRLNLDEADKWGLIYKIVQLKELDKASFLAAKRLCALSPNTLSLHKKIINEGALKDFREEQLKEILASEDTYKRVQSYMLSHHKSQNIKER